MRENAAASRRTPFQLSIQNREPLTFLGPSGCGKTTFLRLIAGPDVLNRLKFQNAIVYEKYWERLKIGE